MDPKKLAKAAAPRNLAAYLMRLPMAMHHGGGHGGDIETVREEDFNGHHIELRTTYRIEVDGRTIHVPLGVDKQGQVHCHSLPNYQTASALDMVKALITCFPDDFPERQTPPKRARGPKGRRKTGPRKKGK